MDISCSPSPLLQEKQTHFRELIKGRILKRLSNKGQLSTDDSESPSLGILIAKQTLLQCLDRSRECSFHSKWLSRWLLKYSCCFATKIIKYLRNRGEEHSRILWQLILEFLTVLPSLPFLITFLDFYLKIWCDFFSPNLQITRLKIDRNPFAKGFRDSGRNRWVLVKNILAVINTFDFYGEFSTTK